MDLNLLPTDLNDELVNGTYENLVLDKKIKVNIYLEIQKNFLYAFNPQKDNGQSKKWILLDLFCPAVKKIP